MWTLLVSSLLLSSYGVFAGSPEEGNMFEGDMELNPDQMEAFEEQMSKKNAFASIKAGLWLTGGKPDAIKYYIDPSINGATSAINQAIADYHQYTCLRFFPQSSRPNGPHIYFTTGGGCLIAMTFVTIFSYGTGCSSPVGRGSGGNSIRLARGCWRKGTIMHEIGHSIGLFHEQSRPDRDNYVTINYNNIVDRARFNFNKLTTSRIDSRGTPYDYDSMMHYGGTYFTKNGKYTIQTKDPKDQRRIGSRSGFSSIDIQQIKKMYCAGTSTTKCVDKDSNCPYWTMYCKTSDYTKNNCKKSCKLPC